MPPGNDGNEDLHIFIDRSIISVIGSNETAITVWTHPATEASDKVALFAKGGIAKVEIEAWVIRSV